MVAHDAAQTIGDTGGMTTAAPPGLDAPPRTGRKPILPPLLIQGPIASLFWATFSMALLAGLGGFAKYLIRAGLPSFEVLFLRNLFCLSLLLPLLAFRGRALLHSENIHLYGVRVTISLLGMMAWFTGLTYVPLAQMQAIGFTSPIFATIGAMLILGERVSIQRWAAIAVGLIGAMIILRPFGGELGLGQGLAFSAAILMGIISPLVKQLTSTDDPDKIVFLTHLGLVPLSFLPAAFVWIWPSPDLLPAILGLGLCAVLGHLALVRAIAAAAASLASCFEFSRLPFAVVIGSTFFGEITDLMTWIGAGIIFAAALYVTRRETKANASAPRATLVRIRDVSDPLGVTPVRVGDF